MTNNQVKKSKKMFYGKFMMNNNRKSYKNFRYSTQNSVFFQKKPCCKVKVQEKTNTPTPSEIIVYEDLPPWHCFPPPI